MELEDGRIQLVLNRIREAGHEFEYDLYELATLSKDGALLDRRPLPSASALSGLDAGSDEVLFSEPGHGGLLVSGWVGPKSLPFYAQLDDRGDVVFRLDFSDMRHTVPALYAAKDGYVFRGWDREKETAILRFYDGQGNLLREGADSALRITRPYAQADGTIWALDDAQGSERLVCLDENGGVLEAYALPESMFAAKSMEAFLRVGGSVAFFGGHQTSADDETSTRHFGFAYLSGGRMAEIYVRGMDGRETGFTRPKVAAFSPESRKVFVFQLGGQDYVAETGGFTPVLSRWAIVELPE